MASGNSVLARLALLLTALSLPFAAGAQIRIGLLVSATGPTTAIGIPQQNTGTLLATAIGGATVEYIQLDDGGDTTRAVQNAKKLLHEYNVDALIGPSTTPAALAILEFVAEAGVPLMATVGTSSVILPMDARRRWVFKTTQNDELIAGVLVKHMARSGVKTLGFIGFKDPYGENWQRVVTPMAQAAGIAIVAAEHYQRTDASVTGQALRLIAARPDAVLVAGVGAPGVLPQLTLRDQGYKGVIYQTHGVATEEFIRLGRERVEGTVLAAGPMLVIDEISDRNPIKKVAQDYIATYARKYGRSPPTFGANTWDAGIVLGRAIPVALGKAKPGTEAFRAALRDAIEAEREIVGCQGVFNMSPADHNGMDERARVLVTVRDGRFRLLSE